VQRYEKLCKVRHGKPRKVHRENPKGELVKILSLENVRKKSFFFAFSSLIRTFAGDKRL
jgi:hypothetical protein